MSDDEKTVDVPLSLVQDLADQHKDAAKFGYENNRTEMGDIHHSWARRLHDADTREWEDVGDA